MARRLVLSFFLASALYSSDVSAGPCRPKPVSSHAVSSVATSDASTGLATQTSAVASSTTDLSASTETDATQTTDSLSLGLSSSLATTAITDRGTTISAPNHATDTSSLTTDSVAIDASSSVTSGLGADTSSFTSGSAVTASTTYTTSGAASDISSYTTGSATTDANTDTTVDTTTHVSSFTTDSVTTDAAIHTTGDATTDISSLITDSATVDTSSIATGSATTDTATHATSDATTDISSITTDSATTDTATTDTATTDAATTDAATTDAATTDAATTDAATTGAATTGAATTGAATTGAATTDAAATDTTYTISESETGTTTGPATTTSADYCTNAEWENDSLIASFRQTTTYAIGVCATAIEAVTTLPATESPETTEIEIIAVTENLPEETKIVIDAPSTNFVAGPDRTVTAVRRGDTIEIVEPKTIYDTVARTTIELPTAYQTVYTTDVDYVGTTSVDTVYDVVDTQTTLMITDTTEITTATSTDVVTETITSIESIPTTSTEYVVTGKTIKFAPGMTIHVTNSRTFVVYSIPSTRTHVLYTSTDYLTSAWTTVTVESTDTDYTTVPTETVDVTTATNTVDKTIVTSTDTDFAASTVTTNEWTTETSIATAVTTKVLDTYTQHKFPWWQNRKRVALPGSLEEQWIGDFGEDHLHSACSCFLPSPLPTRTVYESAELETIFEKSTTIDKIYGQTVTLTLTTAATVTTHKTVTETTVVDGTTSIETRTVHEDVTKTVFSTPTAQSLVTKVVTNDDTKQVTKNIAVIDTITLYGIATGYTWMEVTRTQDIYDLRSKLFPVVQTIGIEETSTSTLPTTTVETTVDVTSTALSTADQTFYKVSTRVVPVAVTDVKKFTYTKTIFTDSTSVYSIEATNTVGTIATTTLTTLTTVTNGVTSTITTVLSTDVTVTAQPVATQVCDMPIKDGDFEYPAGTSPWGTSRRTSFQWDKTNVAGHGKVMQTRDNLYGYDSFIAYQDITSCKGVTFRCSYDYYFDKYYERYMKDPQSGAWGTYIPFIRTYWNNDIFNNPWNFLGNRFPQPDSGYPAGQWFSASIEFTTSGNEDTLWIQAASPQKKNDGNNFIRLDNYVCRPIRYNGPNGPVSGF